eukprot:gb/GFBE01021439.1/.p1 GENE.gb/GFBE01021439.1/~~gb/GFBE01021439.1/.p1  ORF type:complete len:186 (+),score=47.32 gb/GFBE01021439.1/:1-558(+)
MQKFRQEQQVQEDCLLQETAQAHVTESLAALKLHSDKVNEGKALQAYNTVFKELEEQMCKVLQNPAFWKDVTELIDKQGFKDDNDKKQQILTAVLGKMVIKKLDGIAKKCGVAACADAQQLLDSLAGQPTGNPSGNGSAPGAGDPHRPMHSDARGGAQGRGYTSGHAGVPSAGPQRSDARGGRLC